MRNTIRSLVENIKPHDQKESEHIQYALDWIDSEVEIFRLVKPAFSRLLSYLRFNIIIITPGQSHEEIAWQRLDFFEAL